MTKLNDSNTLDALDALDGKEQDNVRSEMGVQE